MKIKCPHCSASNTLETVPEIPRSRMCTQCARKFSVYPPMAVLNANVLDAKEKKIGCPSCRQRYTVDERLCNSLFSCRNCETMFLIPNLEKDDQETVRISKPVELPSSAVSSPKGKKRLEPIDLCLKPVAYADDTDQKSIPTEIFKRPNGKK